MDNYEINKAVAEKLRPNTKVITYMGKLVWDFTDHLGFSYYPVPAYCQSWADVGPIIEDYKISLCPLRYDGWESFVKEGEENPSNKYYRDNKSPLVAAMLVFLDMEI